MLTREQLSAANIAFQAHFLQGLSYTPEVALSALAERVSTPGEPSRKYTWTGFPMGFTQWLDKRIRKDRRVTEYEIINRRWSMVEDIERRAIEEDKLGQFGNTFQMMGINAAQFAEEQLMAKLNEGFTTVGYDGQYFFDTDHSEGDSGSQSNLETGALTRTTLKAARLKLRNLLGDNGRPLGLKGTHLLVSTEAEDAALDIVHSLELVVAGTTDVYRGDYNPDKALIVEVSPFIDPDNWYVYDGRWPLKALTWQVEKEVEWNSVDDPGDSKVFETGVNSYGGETLQGFGYKFWQLIVGSTG